MLNFVFFCVKRLFKQRINSLHRILPADESVSAAFSVFFFTFSLSSPCTHIFICLSPPLPRKKNLQICACAIEEASSPHQPDIGGYNFEYADELACPSTAILSWPPPLEDDQRCTPTASPLYIPPPGTQHVQVKQA